MSGALFSTCCMSNSSQYQPALKDLLSEVFEEHDAAHWISKLRAEGVPAEPINTYSAALADPQVAHSGWVSDLTLASGVNTRTFGFPAVVDGENAPIYRTAPALGEHTQEILAELGLANAGNQEPT